MAALGDLRTIANDGRFQGRVAIAMAVAAASVYSEAAFAATSQSSSSNSKTLTFAAVPSWVTVGSGISNSTTAGSINPNAIITGVTATTVTIDIPLGADTASGDIIKFTQHALRSVFATRVMNGTLPVGITSFCVAVLSNASITAEANVNTIPDFGIADGDIQFTVNSLWNAFAGA